ncbi:MAG: hypothetical protein K2H18_03990 [Muribaculaceae bacterium]|nr:hypothetical protein [Muribaculaceae bacterium]
MNERLNFSWGHIIAFLALLLVSYISFMGLTYLTNGNFTFSIIGMAVIDLVYLAVFIGAQMLKGSGVKMNRKIKMERVVVLASPAIFVIGMIFMSHFFTVNRQEKEIREVFNASIGDTRQLFADYEEYTRLRMENYNKMLSGIISDPAKADLYKQTGFVKEKENVQKENMEETLRLQLNSPSYAAVKESAIKWIDDAQNGATTWNVFILGNTKEIKETIKNWEEQLRNFSSKKMSNEELAGPVPEFKSQGAQAALDGLEKLTVTFTTQKFPTLWAIIFGIVVYFMLILPYLLQRRHTKSQYINLFKKKNRDSGFSINTDYDDNNAGNGNAGGSSSQSSGGTFRL